MKPGPTLLAVIKVIALLAAPILWAGATYQLLDALWPGQVTVGAWRAVATTATLVFGVLTLAMLWRSGVATPGKLWLGLIVLGFFGFAALSLNMRSSCAPGAKYIGEALRPLEVASCQ